MLLQGKKVYFYGDFTHYSQAYEILKKMLKFLILFQKLKAAENRVTMVLCAEDKTLNTSDKKIKKLIQNFTHVNYCRRRRPLSLVALYDSFQSILSLKSTGRPPMF